MRKYLKVIVIIVVAVVVVGVGFILMVPEGSAEANRRGLWDFLQCITGGLAILAATTYLVVVSGFKDLEFCFYVGPADTIGWQFKKVLWVSIHNLNNFTVVVSSASLRFRDMTLCHPWGDQNSPTGDLVLKFQYKDKPSTSQIALLPMERAKAYFPLNDDTDILKTIVEPTRQSAEYPSKDARSLGMIICDVEILKPISTHRVCKMPIWNVLDRMRDTGNRKKAQDIPCPLFKRWRPPFKYF